MDSPSGTTPPATNEDPPIHSSVDEKNQQHAPGTSERTDTFAVQAQSLTNKALQFLSEASNETLGACLVGLGATTYFVLGRVGLVLIGVVGGVALHAHWENKTDDEGDAEARAKEAKRRREVGLDIAQRVLDWRRRNPSSTSEDGSESATVLGLKLHSSKTLDYSKFKPDTAAALSGLTDAIIQDYVKYWYHPIIPDEDTFPSSCRRTLTGFIRSISTNLSRKRPADTFLEFLTNSSSVVIVFLNELSTAFAASPSSTAQEALHTYLELKSDSSLANILDRQSQLRKLELVSEDIVHTYLDPGTYNCDAAHVFLRQVLAKVVLEMTIQSCSTPEFINTWIAYLLEEGEPELMNAIDAGMEGSAGESLQKLKEEVVEPAEHASSTESTPERDPTSKKSQRNNEHKRRVSRAEQAMEDAMQEAKRLTELIAEEDARKMKEQQQAIISASAVSIMSDDTSENTTQGVQTPTSSQSDQNASSEHNSVSDPALVQPRSSEHSENEDPSSLKTKPEEPQRSFTSFDQILPSQQPTALSDATDANGKDALAKELSQLTLTNASISIFDDSIPGQKQQTLRSKPQGDYLIQIEPANNAFSGWMIARKYADFETLHEVLRRISVIAGVGFTEAHEQLPSWKIHHKASLRGELERYLNDATKWRPLAESEGMKRFLEKNQGLNRSPSSNKGAFGWPAPASVGKGVINALAQAPKEVAGGGKAFIGGVAGVFGAGTASQKRASISQSNPSRSSVSLSRVETNSLAPAPTATPRLSQESSRNSGSPIVDKQPTLEPQMERRPSVQPEEGPEKPRYSRPGSLSTSPARIDLSREPIDLGINISSNDPTPTHPPINLPPPPSEISDDYGSRPPSPTRASIGLQTPEKKVVPHSATLPPRPQRPSNELGRSATAPEGPPKVPTSGTKTQKPLTSQEAQVAVELLFAVINELYTLSSAWTFRRTLLTAAKTFLLRPGNPQLETIRVLLQDTVITANTSDSGTAGLIRKIRENALPTESELDDWKKSGAETWEGVRDGKTVEERKDELRKRARRLLVQRGMPQALTSVMGQAASGEALGKVFDCLQVEEVARGLIFGLLLQGIRAVTQ
ncbi:MAG: hypothetical protein M1821_008688 [Bathelium mastoideum]|nr:MAG: hypothetical protein M1821_008688 [Bathelium mastoideum]